MSNPVQQSLKDNEAEILKNLPEEFKADLEKQIADAAPAPQMTDAEEAEAIKTELKENPDIDDAAVIPEFEKNPTAHHMPPPPSQEEQDAELKKRQEEMGQS